MADKTLQPVKVHTMKLRLYPSGEQKQKMETFFRALHVAYNITFHEVFQRNPEVCTAPKEDGAVWPDFKKITNAKWKQYLISQNLVVAEAPAASLTTNGGVFLKDGKRAWEKVMQKGPVNPERRREFHFYNAAHPRRSFLVQVPAKNISPSPDNGKVAWITIPKAGRMKARGFDQRLRFGEDGQYSYAGAIQSGWLTKNLTVQVSKDTCGDFFASITFSDGKKGELYLELPAAEAPQPVGVDAGIKDVAIMSTGDKIANPHFKKKKEKSLERLNRALSRRWGPANMGYRDYNKAIRQENHRHPEDPPEPLAQPGRRYLATQQKKARLERRIACQRETYYHQQTALLVRRSSLIAVESLKVKNMMRNHKLAFALADAAMSRFLSMVKYKAERLSVPLLETDTFAPTSQLCSVCGAKYPPARNLSVRTWKCPSCGTYHDRDVNAARNILALAQCGGKPPDAEDEVAPPKPSGAGTRRRRRTGVIPEHPEVNVVYSRELTRRNDPRYIIINTATGRVMDDAQGAGYRSISNAVNCYKAKLRRAALADQHDTRASSR